MLGQSTRGGGADNTTWLRLNAKTGDLVQDLSKVAKFDKDGKPDGFDYPKATFTKIEDARVKRVFIIEKANFEDPSKMDKLVNVSLVDDAGTQVVIQSTQNDFGLKLLGLLNGADLSQPITLNLGAFEKDSEGMKKDSATGLYTIPYKRIVAEPWMTLAQGEPLVKVKADFGLPAGTFPPRVDKIIVKDPASGEPLEGVKPVMDPRKRNAFILDFTNKLATKVAESSKSHPSVAPKQAAPAAADDDAGLSPANVLGEDDVQTLAHQ